MKKSLVLLLIVAVLIVSGLAAFLLVISPRLKAIGKGGVEDWVARQVVRIANAYLVPEVQYDTFTYTHPGVLELKGARLIAPDGAKTRVVEAGVIRVTLAEVPTFGQPIVIERIDLEKAALRLLRDPATGGFKGLLPFVKGENITDQNRVDAQVQLSKVLKIKKVTLTDGELQYNDGAGPETMTLKGVTLNLDVQPDSSGDAGWYAMKLNVDRAPVFSVKGDAALNVDSLESRFKPLTISVSLSEQDYSALPPELQRPLKEHDARGDLQITLNGTVPLRDAMSAEADAAVTLRNFNVAAGEYRLPIDTGELAARLSAGTLTASKAQASLLGGTLTASGLTLGVKHPARPVSLSWNASNLELRELLRTKTSPGEAPKLAGRFNSQGNASGSLASMPNSLNGRGMLTVRDGRLVAVPVLTDLMASMELLGKAAGVNTLQDAADIDFDFTPDGVKVTRGEATTPAATAKFTGLIRYDSTLDLVVNAGPLEKVQGLLGKVGGIIGEVTDKLVKYRVTGPISAPKIEVKPLGL